jgi:MOSC domain-containing protein YiiM
VSVRSKPEQPESAQPVAQAVGTLVSVNVGMPKNVPWQGKNVYTGVFKDPVSGHRRVGRLNIEGDGQGDRAGHGGEQRAVFVYQIDSYRYWERELARNDFVYGQFGENFTVEGLGDDEVCIGDRYQIGTATFEVTQPRVTCYRVGIRMNDPRIPALLVSHHRPGFYFRVLEEGEVQAGDEITKLASGPEQMPVAEADALLYLPGHPRQQLLRALRIPALSPGWQASFQSLLEEEPGSGNAGLAVTSPPPAWPGFRQLTVTAINRESESVISIRLDDPDGAPVPAARPGQYLTLRVQPDKQQRSLLRNYSLSGPPDAGYYRITVKREHDGAASGYLHTRVAVGDQLDIAAPRGTFILDRTHAPVLLISAGSVPRQFSPCFKRWRRSIPIARSGGCTAHATDASTHSPPRPRVSSPRFRTCIATCTTAVPIRMTSKAEISPARAVSRDQCSPNSSRPAMPRHTCADLHRSWTRSVRVWGRWGSTPHASAPSRSGPHQA